MVRYAEVRRRVDKPISMSAMDQPDHILIVDDDAEIRTLLGTYLSRNGLKATAVSDGKAMWRARSRAPTQRHPIGLTTP